MATTFALAALAALAYAAPQGVTTDIAPPGSPPPGFVETYPSSFQITAVNSTVAKRDLAPRQSAACPTAPGSLVITLTGGVLTDQNGRTGYIASNYQFQFDKPPQAGAIYTGGFSVGTNSSLALGSSAIFYECLSGGFYNLYNTNWAPQCAPILIDILPCGAASAGEVTQASDGQPAATGLATVVTQISDGQPQAATAIPITQISDGQPQIPTAVISQISDGQPQAPTTLAMPISQISDGQPQAPTATAAPITQISDGQPQAPTTAAPALTSAAPPAVISQISDGQIQAPNGTSVSTPTAPAVVTASGGNAVTVGSGLVAVLVGLVAALL
jgi:hypothetical protein